MPWARIDDDAPSHPKLVKAGSIAAFGYWVAGNCYCNRRLTDGFIAEDALSLLTPIVRAAQARRLAQRLVDADLWERVAGGYRVHDFDQYNPSADEVKAARRSRAERQRRWRSGRRRGSASTVASTDAGVDASVDASTCRRADGGVDAAPRARVSPARAYPGPARPLPPTVPLSTANGTGPTAEQQHRIAQAVDAMRNHPTHLDRHRGDPERTLPCQPGWVNAHPFHAHGRACRFP